MLKRIWWTVKVGLFPHMERRKYAVMVADEKRRARNKMRVADSMLDSAISDLTNAIEGGKR